MSCQEFTEMVSELAGLSLMDAARREAAQAHAEGCVHCRTRLIEERALVSGLKELSCVDLRLAAPVVVEERLRSAYRQHLKVTPDQAPGVERRFSRLILLAAAILLAIIGMTVFALRANRQGESQVLQGGSQQLVGQKRSEPVSVGPSPQASPEAPTQPRVQAQRGMTRSNRSRYSSPPPPDQAANLAKVGSAGSSVTVSLGAFVPVSNEGEITTDFLPMQPGADDQAVESGRVIRVQMPRAALASFGLPFNMERANESVKADVLLGDDGIARAIRFVR